MPFLGSFSSFKSRINVCLFPYSFVLKKLLFSPQNLIKKILHVACENTLQNEVRM